MGEQRSVEPEHAARPMTGGEQVEPARAPSARDAQRVRPRTGVELSAEPHGQLVHTSTGREWLLPARCLVGRGPSSLLRLQDRSVSGEHASIAHHRGRWEIRDLSSRNGTWVNGVLLSPGSRRPLAAGDEIAFGGPAERWRLVTSGAPPAMAFDAAGVRRSARRGLLSLPDDDRAEAVVFAQRELWIAELTTRVQTVTDGALLELASGAYRLVLPELDPAHAQSTVSRGSLEPTARVRLCFRVSRDEEHVALEVVDGPARCALPARAYFYLLLTLARRKLEDLASGGVHDDDCGWCYADELAARLGMTPEKLNVDIHRARRLLQEHGVRGAGELIERRPQTRQLRLGAVDAEVLQS